MRRRNAFCLLALAGALCFLAFGCGGGGTAESTPGTTSAETQTPSTDTGGSETGGTETAPATGEAPHGPEGLDNPLKGGTFRVAVEGSYGFTDNFDPTGEYLADAWRIQSNLMLRALMGYRHIAGPPGNELIPDLADGMPEISADGLTYTFHLKSGIKFSPPVNREVTSKDVLYAFERIGTPAQAAQYGFYYLGTVAGLQEYYDGKADTISGIETPDDKTIIFHLTAPTGDFLYRLAMSATAPIPEEVAKCFTKAGDYGRFVISNGPYMLEGSDKLDITSCGTMKEISGYKPNTYLNLVRNPNYDPATDTPESRENLPDRFEFTINSNTDDIFNKIEAGEEDAEIASTPPKQVAKYLRSEDLKNRMQINPDDCLFYISLTLTQPPFDDIHVRKAVNLALDKEGIRRTRGGETAGLIAHHVFPDSLVADQLKDYDPYPSQGDAGDLAAAKEEMKQSKYDTNGDGVCDASACNNVLHVTSNLQANKDFSPIIEQDFQALGITLTTRYFDDAFSIVQTTSKNVPINSVGGWCKDYPDPTTYAVLFNSSTIIPNGNSNYSLVGLTPDMAPKLKVTGTIEGIPSVDADIAACQPLSGDDRLQCWENLDKKLMEEVVPWIPYIQTNQRAFLGPGVAKWVFDQSGGDTAYAHVAVDPSKQSSG